MNFIYSITSFFGYGPIALQRQKELSKQTLNQELLKNQGPPQTEIEQEFQDLSQNTSLLLTARDPSLEICQCIQQNIRNLIEYSEVEINALESEDEQLVADMRQVTDDYTQLCQNQRNCMLYLTDANAELEKFHVIKSDLDRMREQCASDIEYLQNQSDQVSITREQALTDINPVAGVIGGLLTGRYERMIPFYSTISGVISMLTQDKEEFESSLEKCQYDYHLICDDIDSISFDITHQNEYLQQINQDISRLNDDRNQLDVMIKKLGKKITSLRNINQSLQEFASKYEFLTFDLEQIQTLISEDSLESNLIYNFAKDIISIRDSFMTMDLI